MSKEEPSYSDLKKIEGHKNFYRNPLSQKITWKRRGVWIRTGVTQITRAKEVVEQELAKRQGRAEPNVRKRLKGVSNPLLSDTWELLLEEKRTDTKESTLKTYEKNWRVALKPFWGEKYVQDLTPETFSDYKNWYLTHHPKRYFKKTFIHFQWFLKGLVKAKYLLTLPSLEVLEPINDKVQKNSKRVKAGRVLSKGELAKLEAAAISYVNRKDIDIPAEHKEMLSNRGQLGLAFGAFCGMRKMEILSLKWEHINFEEAVAKVWSDKNDKWRDVPLVPKLLKLLEAQRRFAGESEFIFPMPRDNTQHLSSQNFDRIWKVIKKMAGFKQRTRFHDLRHTFATRTAEENWPPVLACSVLDMSLGVYQREYCKPSFEKKSEWMNKTFGGEK